MAAKNQYGLSRDIPEPIKRSIRQAAGFGCVLCGFSIVDYDHFDPPFSKARSHDAKGITLLCARCHTLKTRNLISDRPIREAVANPKCKQTGFSFGVLDPAVTQPVIKFAGATFEGCPIPVQVRGLPLFAIEDPEEVGGPFRLSASFFNASGLPSLFIRRNEWRVFSDEWDVEFTGNRIVVRAAPGRVSLRVAFLAGVGIEVEKVDMAVNGYEFEGDSDTLRVRVPGSSGFMSFTASSAKNCAVGMSFN